MTINVYKKDDSTVIAPEGKIDHVTTLEFENTINEAAKDSDKLTLDMAGVEYVSSAALRAILRADNLVQDKGGLTIINVNQKVMEILKITGISDYLNIM